MHKPIDDGAKKGIAVEENENEKAEHTQRA